MNFFEEATLRLKQQLKVTEDNEVAELLGLKPTAWAMRKKRQSFPEKELYALAVKRPELNLDVDYVLTGIAREAHARLDAESGAGQRAADTGAGFSEIRAAILAAKADPMETALIVAWRKCSKEDRTLLSRLAASLAEKDKGLANE